MEQHKNANTTFEPPADAPKPDAEAIKAARERDEAKAEAEPDAETNPPADPEADEAEEAEPELEPEPEDVAMGVRLAELEKAQTAYFKKVEKVLAPDPMPSECPTCHGTGLNFAGHEAAPDYQTNEQFIACDACVGLGKVLTGSRVIGAEALDCPKCMGRGYLEKTPQIVAVPSEPEQYGTPTWMGTTAPPTQ